MERLLADVAQTQTKLQRTQCTKKQPAMEMPKEFQGVKPLEAAMSGAKEMALKQFTKEAPPPRIQTSILLYSILFFMLQYAIAWFLCYRKWRGQKRMRACSCTISFTHSLVVSVLTVQELVTSPWRLDSPNNGVQNRIMEWSMAFFIVDLLHYAVAAPSDFLFISHHLATLFYLLSCRYYSRAGAKSVICLLAAGEITTPLQSIWTISRLRSDQSAFAEKVYTALSPVFTVAFTLVRGVLGPYLWWELLKFYLWNHSQQSIPKWLGFCWMFKVTIGIVGSIIWGYRLWCGLLKFYLQRMRIFQNPSQRRRYD